MKTKRIKYALFLFFAIACLALILNIKVITKQGVNYKVHSIKIPLYLKILDFFDRHYNYAETVKRITAGSKMEEEKVIKIFRWVYSNIKRNPKELPVIDDHTLNIIIRGYGVNDQFSDVFTTLCNYAGIKAFYSLVYTKTRAQRIPLSFVRINKKWFVFDPYCGVYFKDEKGSLADIEILKSGRGWEIMGLDGNNQEVDYAVFFLNLASIKDMELGRSNIQTPFRRLFFEFNKLKKY